MTDHLTPAELAELTGSKAPGPQTRWLQARRVPYRYNGSGVYVLRAVAKEWELLQGLSKAVPRMDLVT